MIPSTQARASQPPPPLAFSHREFISIYSMIYRILLCRTLLYNSIEPSFFKSSFTEISSVESSFIQSCCDECCSSNLPPPSCPLTMLCCSSSRWDRALQVQYRHELIRSIDQKNRSHKERMLRLKGPDVGRTWRAPSPLRQTVQRKTAERVHDPGLISMLSMTDEDVPNELAGPFRDSELLLSKPAVKHMSTFEDYLERTVNAARASPVRFEDHTRSNPAHPVLSPKLM